MGYLVSRCSFRFRGIPFLILGNFISDFGYFYYTLYTHFSLTISNGSVPRTRHLRLSETTTENSPVHLVYPNIPCVPFLVLLRLVRFCTSYTALSLPAHPVSFQDLSLSLGIIKSAESATVFVRKTVSSMPTGEKGKSYKENKEYHRRNSWKAKLNSIM